jgi:hypothetical protein
LQHRLIELEFLEGNINAKHICNAIIARLGNRRLNCSDFVAIAVDGCLVNISAHQVIEWDQRDTWLFNLCISNCTNNASTRQLS